MTFPPHLIQHSHLSQAARLAAAMHTHRTFLVQHTKTAPLIGGTTKTPGFHELHLKQVLSYTEITEEPCKTSARQAELEALGGSSE